MKSKILLVFIMFFVVFSQKTQADVLEKVISITAHKGMTIYHVYKENELYRSKFKKFNEFTAEFCRLNKKLIKTCSDREFRALPVKKQWLFPAIPEVYLIPSTEKSIQHTENYKKHTGGLYRVIQQTNSIPKKAVSLTLRNKTELSTIYNKNILYRSIFHSFYSFRSEFRKLNDIQKKRGDTLPKNSTWFFPPIPNIYAIKSIERILHYETIYTKDTERGFYRISKQTDINTLHKRNL